MLSETLVAGAPLHRIDTLRNTRLDREAAPVFQQEWFLEAAAGPDALRECVVSDGDVELGCLPYTVASGKFGLLWGGLPHWAHIIDPLVRPGLDTAARAVVLQKLAAQLPTGIRFTFACLPSGGNADAFRTAMQSRGFKHSTQVTYSFPADDLGILSRFNKKHRTHIRAAEKSLKVSEIDAGQFIDFYAANLGTRGIDSYAPLGLAKRIMLAGANLAQAQVRIIAAHNHAHVLQPCDAAVACVWDQQRYYLWMASRRLSDDTDAPKPHPDAVKLLVIAAAEHARRLGRTFDLDGVTHPGQENFYQTVLKAPCREVRDVYKRQRSYLRAISGLKIQVAIQTTRKSFVSSKSV